MSAILYISVFFSTSKDREAKDMGFRAFRFPYPVVLAPILFSTASFLDLWLKNPLFPLNPLFRFPSSSYEFNFLFLLTLRYIILDIFQPATLSSAEKIDDQEDGSICFFPLKSPYISIYRNRNLDSCSEHSDFKMISPKF